MAKQTKMIFLVLAAGILLVGCGGGGTADSESTVNVKEPTTSNPVVTEPVVTEPIVSKPVVISNEFDLHNSKQATRMLKVAFMGVRDLFLFSKEFAESLKTDGKVERVEYSGLNYINNKLAFCGPVNQVGVVDYTGTYTDYKINVVEDLTVTDEESTHSVSFVEDSYLKWDMTLYPWEPDKDVTRGKHTAEAFSAYNYMHIESPKTNIETVTKNKIELSDYVFDKKGTNDYIAYNYNIDSYPFNYETNEFEFSFKGDINVAEFDMDSVYLDINAKATGSFNYFESTKSDRVVFTGNYQGEEFYVTYTSYNEKVANPGSRFKMVINNDLDNPVFLGDFL